MANNSTGEAHYIQNEDGSITLFRLSPGVCVTMKDGVFMVQQRAPANDDLTYLIEAAEDLVRMAEAADPVNGPKITSVARDAIARVKRWK